MSEHAELVEPFADLHFEHGLVRATLLHDPTVEGLDMALYLDGSGSMGEEYEYKARTGAFWDWLFGRPATPPTNEVEPQARWMLEYLATKDRNGLLRVGYWACGASGRGVEILGELKGVDVKSYRFPGPRQWGRQTVLTPAMRDYVEYLRAQVTAGAKQGCAVFITDGAIHDAEDVKQFSREIAKQIRTGRLPRMNFILVGVGEAVDEKQMEDICHEEYRGIGHLWCHRIAEEIDQVAKLVAVLVDETMTVAGGGTIYDDRGRVVKVYEGRLPAVLEFEVAEGTTHFTLEVNGQRFTQPLREHEDGHQGEEEDDDHH